MTLYEHLPVDIRETVDALVVELKPQPWPTRFFVLIGLLGEKLEVLDRLIATCPDWEDIVDSVLEANQRRPIKAARAR